MKGKMSYRIAAAALVCVMLLSTACGKKFDASGYVKACLDLSTRGETAEYMKLTQRTEEQAKQDYENNVDEIMTDFKQLGLSDDLQDKYRTFFVELLKKTDYTVKEAKKGADKDSYVVEVEVKQIKGIFDNLQDELTTQAQDYMMEIQSQGTEVTQEEVWEKVFTMMYDILNEKLAGVTYGEPQTVEVNVKLMDDKTYGIPDEDYEKLDAAMIDMADLQ